MIVADLHLLSRAGGWASFRYVFNVHAFKTISVFAVQALGLCCDSLNTPQTCGRETSTPGSGHSMESIENFSMDSMESIENEREGSGKPIGNAAIT
jgi:hypothetical protein